MKIVINKCFGGFSLSPLAVKRLAELYKRECYFFKHNFSGPYIPLTLKEAEEESLFWVAFDIPSPDEILGSDENWHEMTSEEKKAHSSLYEEHVLDNRSTKRNDPKLIQVIEELGKKANGTCADLEIVEIPDAVEWEIEEYDGKEHIAEKHRTWY